MKYIKCFESFISENKIDDIDWTFYDLENEIRYELMGEFIRDLKAEMPGEEECLKARQKWTTLGLQTFKIQWTSYMKNGDVIPAYWKTIDKMENMFTRNVIKLSINTELAGHTTNHPKYLWDEYFQGQDIENLDEYIEYVESRFSEWIEDENGQVRISDYALEPLLIEVHNLRRAPMKNKIPIMDRMLHILHFRSDISKLFIEGGGAALDSLSSENSTDKVDVNQYRK